MNCRKSLHVNPVLKIKQMEQAYKIVLFCRLLPTITGSGNWKVLKKGIWCVWKVEEVK